jgi:unsaturated chondroitin disaccharide hydrolase
MGLKIDSTLTPKSLEKKIEAMFTLSAEKIRSIERSWNPEEGTPVFTVKGKYTSRGWTEWTQGFQFGAAFLQFDATGEREFLEVARLKTVRHMASHVSHIGVHDHGFNNVSTYGNLWRLMHEGKVSFTKNENDFCELALKISGAVQAARWTKTNDGGGFIYSFNGPHSLFIDTMRSLRSLAVAHQLDHVLMGERDSRISLLDRLVAHARTTAAYAIYYGKGRDSYDIPGRTAHESIFNTNDGSYRCPNSQQGYSPFSTWTRGLAWAICGYAEQLEFLSENSEEDLTAFKKAAIATADFYLENCCADGIPMWDTGAPNLYRLGEYLQKSSDPYNAWEPVDSSAAAIAAQGFLRLGRFLKKRRYTQAALTILNTLLQEPYLSLDPKHQGLLLHSVYHRPNGWDHIARGQKIPNGESSMWGDYHLREAALLVLRQVRNEPYLTFFKSRNQWQNSN